MGEKIIALLEKMATGKKNRIFWAVVIMLAIISVMAYPRIDASLLFYNRIETRVENLQKLASVSGGTVSEDDALRAEYEDILADMAEARERAEMKEIVEKDSDFERNVKFWSGAFLGSVLAAWAFFFTKNPNGKMTFRFFLTNNVAIALLCIIVAFVSGMICIYIPTLWTVWLNAFLAPILQFIFWDLLISSM